MNKNTSRELYLDIIRIIAAFLVIFTHTGNIGSKLYIYGDYGRLRNTIYIMADIIRCINVPLFFMVSGALLLGKRESYKILFYKRIFRYIIVLISMSYFYFVVYYGNVWYDFLLFFKQLCTQYVTGLYWFLYEYIGYLLILPFLRKMIINMEKKDYQYLLIMGILFKGVLGVITGLCWHGNFQIPFRFGVDAVFYPVMGYYLSKMEFKSESKKVSIKREFTVGLIVSCMSVICAGLMMNWEARQAGEYTENYLSCFNVVPTLYVFAMIKYGCERWKIPSVITKVISFMGENSFGIYLFSIYAQVKMLRIYNLINKIIPAFPLIACLLYVGAVLIIEAILVSLLRKLPVVKKFI